MDLFGKHALAASKERCNGLERELTIKGNDLNVARNIIREMDDRIFRISQCTEWNSMRPHIGELIAMMESRRRAESDRIGGIILGELNR